MGRGTVTCIARDAGSALLRIENLPVSVHDPAGDGLGELLAVGGGIADAIRALRDC